MRSVWSWPFKTIKWTILLTMHFWLFYLIRKNLFELLTRKHGHSWSLSYPYWYLCSHGHTMNTVRHSCMQFLNNYTIIIINISHFIIINYYNNFLIFYYWPQFNPGSIPVQSGQTYRPLTPELNQVNARAGSNNFGKNKKAEIWGKYFSPFIHCTPLHI